MFESRQGLAFVSLGFTRGNDRNSIVVVAVAVAVVVEIVVVIAGVVEIVL